MSQSLQIVTFKFHVVDDETKQEDIRRVTLRAPVTLTSLNDAACDILKWPGVAFKFKDEEGEQVTVASQHELDTAIAFANGAAVHLHALKRMTYQQPQQQKQEQKQEQDKPAEPAAAAAAAETTPDGNLLDTAPNATLPDNVMIQFSAMAEFFQQMAQKMAEFVPRIPALMTESARKMGSDISASMRPLETTMRAARAAPRDERNAEPAYTRVVLHRLPDTVVHPGTECAHCHKKPITGMRYRCVQCECDLCQDCVLVAGAHAADHMFVPVCAPPVGSHFVAGAAAACDSAKARAEPVVRTVRDTVEGAVASARAKGTELTDKVKQRVAEEKDKQQPKPEQPKPEQPKPEQPKPEQPKPEQPKQEEEPPKQEQPKQENQDDGLTKKERDMLQTLAEMGFEDRSRLLPLIRRYKDTNRVVQELLS